MEKETYKGGCDEDNQKDKYTTRENREKQEGERGR